MFLVKYLMKRRKLAAASFLFLVCQFGFLLSPAVPRAQQAEPEVVFKWAFGVLTGQGDQQKLEAVTKDTILNTGDQFKMMVELQHKCYVYVFHHDARDGMKMLFPYSLDQFSTDYQPGRKYYIPHGDAWYRLDENTGAETLYLLASADRLNELEDLFTRYESAGPGDKPQALKAVLDEIKKIKREHREFAAPAERPTPIGGAIRGIEKRSGTGYPDVAKIADDMMSSGFIARTYTIEHR